MTAKEKAFQLVYMFERENLNKEFSKKCANVIADELIDQLQEEEQDCFVRHWNNVKQEIEKL